MRENYIYTHTHIKPSQGGASKIHSYPISSFGKGKPF